jgi:hypothetical protein
MILLIFKRVMGFFFFIGLFALTPGISIPGLAQTPPALDLKSLAQSPEWKGLLQYQKNIFGAESSEVAGKDFFFSPQGETDPLAELQATLLAFSQPLIATSDGDNEHPLCKFPARLIWAKKNHLLDESKLAHPHCSGYLTYKNRIQTKKLSVVFTSYFLGSASSIFGHSFLKFSGENENELFDTGINFAANPTTNNPILYALYGKVREYHDFESRDLWTYELALTAEQRDFLLDHLWELGNTYYHYYYFNQNCSYHILRAIEGAVPSIRFFKRRPVYLIPSESIQLLYHVPGLVKSVAYRPSIRSTAYARYENLNEPEKTAVRAALKEKSLAPLQSLPRQVAALDTLTDALDLNHADDAWKEKVLGARANISTVSPAFTPDTPELEAPQLGHPTRRIIGGPGMRTTDHRFESFTEVEVRASHHDLLDPSVGYPRNLHIDFGRVAFQYLDESKRLLLNDLTIVDLTALSIDHPLYSKISYNAHLGFDRPWFVDCRDAAHCPVTEARGGVGKAIPLFDQNVAFFLIDAAPSYGTEYFDSHFKFSLLPQIGSLFEFNPHFKLLAKSTADYTFFTAHHFGTLEDVGTRYVFNNSWGLDFDAQYGTQGGQTMNQFLLRGLYYF